MGTCSSQNCNYSCFEEKDKCILHCQKINSFQLDNNIESFFAALIEYITDQLLISSKTDYSKAYHSVISNEETKNSIINFLNESNDNTTTSFDEKILKNKITLKDVIFPICGSLDSKYNYVNILNKLLHIEFSNCHFEDEIALHNNINLIFRKCTFSGIWKHIFCKKIKYLSCEFEEFVINNISEDKLIVENHLLYNCKFIDICCSGTIFKKRFFKYNNINKYKKIENIELINCEFEEDFILNITDNENKEDLKYFTVTNINFEHSIFHKKVKIQFCNIIEKANFYNTSFKNLADFYLTKFDEVVFERTDFEKISVFSETEFKQNVDFKYTKFLGKSIFRDMVIKGKLNLRDSIFDDDATFLDITSKQRTSNEETKEFYGEPKVISVANRETARLIKNFYDSSNNIIEANKFYALEMKEREKELGWDIAKGKNIFDWLIFKIHGKSSNHSQDWMLPILWILNISLIYSMCISTFWHNNMLAIIQIVVLSGLFFINRSTVLKIVLSMNLVIFLPLSYISLDTIANNINPFSIMIGSEKLTFELLVFKITIAYLIYQSIVSVRQNTRRK